MNKLTKASIAAGAGIMLLLGGGGTLAYWNASATVANSSITAGTLGLTSTGAGVWQDASTSTPVIINTSTFRVVPGDTLTYTESFAVAATGANLKADVTTNFAGLVSGGAWDDELTSTIAVTKGGTAVTQITSADNGATITVTVTLVFAYDGDVVTAGTQVNNLSQGATVNLNGLAITLTQVR